MRRVAAVDGELVGRIAHLARRAGFGLPVQGINGLAARGLDAAITYFVEYDRLSATISLAKPHLNDDPNIGDVTPLQIWWLDRMIRSERQLEEKMTLFWHGFFATSEDKVDWPSAMYNQQMLFRRHALGDFQDLLTAICIDPAMLIWLDGDYSTKDAPNENFARESMELFSIGIGNYTQRDVREAARALTGWYIDDHYKRQYEPSYHDGGIKTYLGKTGRWAASDIARILANHPACGRFLARKLWTFFAYEQPETAIVEELAAVYHQSGRNMREVVRRLFKMPQFYSDRAIGGRVKSPVEHVVIAVREFGAQVKPNDLNDALWVMGQYLFYPPNVGGWPTGTRWVNTATAVARFNFAEWLLERQSDPSKNRVDLGWLLSQHGAGDWPGTLALLARYHLAAQPTDLTMQALAGLSSGPTQGDDAQATLESILHLLMVAPEYYCA